MPLHDLNDRSHTQPSHSVHCSQVLQIDPMLSYYHHSRVHRAGHLATTSLVKCNYIHGIALKSSAFVFYHGFGTYASVCVQTILITLSSTRSPRVFASTLPSAAFRLCSSSHQPKRKSRAINLNQGVKEFSEADHQYTISTPSQRDKHTRIIKHSLQLLFAHVFVVPDLVRVGDNRDIGSQEQNVVHCVSK